MLPPGASHSSNKKGFPSPRLKSKLRTCFPKPDQSGLWRSQTCAGCHSFFLIKVFSFPAINTLLLPITIGTKQSHHQEAVRMTLFCVCPVKLPQIQLCCTIMHEKMLSNLFFVYTFWGWNRATGFAAACSCTVWAKRQLPQIFFQCLLTWYIFFLFLLVSTSPFYPAARQIPPTDTHCRKSASVTYVRGKKTPKWPQTTGSSKLQHANDRWLRPGCPLSSQSWAAQRFTWLTPSACLLAIRRVMVFLCRPFSLLWWWPLSPLNSKHRHFVTWLIIKMSNGLLGRFIKLQTPVSKPLY